MIHRREFFRAAYVTLLLVPLGNVACSSTSPSAACNGVASLSSVAVQHTHAVCVAASDLSVPPPGGAVYTTTVSNGHTHQIMLSQDDLRSIEGGQSVTVTTTTVAGHTHGFLITRATQLPPQAGTPAPF